MSRFNIIFCNPSEKVQLRKFVQIFFLNYMRNIKFNKCILKQFLYMTFDENLQFSMTNAVIQLW